MDGLLMFFVFVLGLLVGSFLNALSFRYGFSESNRSRSGCQACGKTLKWYELVPLVSYVFLLGKCHTCGSKLSMQYPIVELLLGVIFFLTFLSLTPTLTVFSLLQFVFILFFWSVFLLLAVYDFRHTLVPLPFIWTLFSAALLVQLVEFVVTRDTAFFIDGLLGLGVLAAFFLLLVLITRGRGMGVGDIYVAGILGFFFGLMRGIEVVTLAFWIGAVFGILLLALKKGFKMKTEVPFIPFLFVAALIGAFTTFSPIEFIGALVSLP